MAKQANMKINRYKIINLKYMYAWGSFYRRRVYAFRQKIPEWVYAFFVCKPGILVPFTRVELFFRLIGLYLLILVRYTLGIKMAQPSKVAQYFKAAALRSRFNSTFFFSDESSIFCGTVLCLLKAHPLINAPPMVWSTFFWQRWLK